MSLPWQVLVAGFRSQVQRLAVPHQGWGLHLRAAGELQRGGGGEQGAFRESLERVEPLLGGGVVLNPGSAKQACQVKEAEQHKDYEMERLGTRKLLEASMSNDPSMVQLLPLTCASTWAVS